MHVFGDSFKRFTLRKAFNITSPAFSLFFSKPLPSLLHLNLDECILLTDDVLVDISAACPYLEHFTATWCPQLRYLGVKCLVGRCLRLRKLNMTGTKKLTDEAFTEFIPKQEGEKVVESAFRVMKKLNLESCDYVGDELLLKIKRCYPHIKIYNYFKEEVEL
ncbi:hypothetical protein FGO68_gene9155 [Halteria grandinella]|uniref:Uncharacterized protein n=1 Tax=Halteria grandinella TaxID=5974 RepID=A0A8J8T1D0_HALGN|nr:hypothetical protein FGO68_gene9155 [Halteria grandinella]